jgi:hypothetical protein
MKALFQSRIEAGLSRVFSSEVSAATGYAAISKAQWALLADAISDIAIDIVSQIQTEAQVLPGQSTSDGATTTSPGTIN